MNPTTDKDTRRPSQLLAARRRASHRLPPLTCGRRDPWIAIRQSQPEPSTFGLDADELRDEANRLAALGWALDEVLVRLAVGPRLVKP